jgi:hypothetical protein
MKHYTGIKNSATSGEQHDENTRRHDSERFNFWLITTMLAAFILLLFYSQKIQGLM